MASGRYHFSAANARAALGLPATAANSALYRLKKQGLIGSPGRGFYVVIPPEYRGLGCLPADQFVPALMEREGRSYYAGLLTAAQYHGAAHQRPQAFQVFVTKRRRGLSCGRVRVTFLQRKGLGRVPTESVNTPRGTLRLSTPAATAIDLLGYSKQSGGLDHVVQVLAELAEQIRPEDLPGAAATAPIAWAQRLGYVLESVVGSKLVAHLKEYVRDRAPESTALLPSAPHDTSERDTAWRLWVNASVEPEQ